MTSALLIVDVQRALCTGDEAAHDADRLIGRINDIAAWARQAAAPVVYVQHEESHGNLRHGSEGWQLDERLAAQPEDARVRKTAPNAFEGTGLHALLQELAVDRVVVCGLQSDCCIDASVRGAAALGYPVVLVADAHATVASGGSSAAEISERHNQALAALAAEGRPVAVIPAARLRSDG